MLKEWCKFSYYLILILKVYDSNVLISDGTKPLFTDYHFITSLVFVLIHFVALLIVSRALFQKRNVR